MVWCKWESLIPNIIADKAIDADKRWDIAANKKLNTVADKTVDTKKEYDIAAEPSILIKDQIIK